LNNSLEKDNWRLTVSRDSSQKRDEFWVSLVEFCREPSATNGRMLLEEQFREGWLYASLAKAQLQPSEIASAVGNFGKYLKHRKDNPKNYSSEDALDFACHCPLCRGKKGVHYTRVFELACTVYEAVYFSQHTALPEEERLKQAAVRLNKAAQLFCPDAPEIEAVSWAADKDKSLRDLLCQYAARYPDPALNLIDELLHYFLHGQWRPSQRGVAATFPLAFQNGGAIAKLALEQTDALVPGFYPHPELLLATRWDRSLRRAVRLRLAAPRARQDRRAALGAWNPTAARAGSGTASLLAVHRSARRSASP
jgi:hypothetical protein